MGLMATYAGMIYSDFFALQVNFWGSCYDIDNPSRLDKSLNETVSQTWFVERRDPACTYPFGLDPAWGIAKVNMLTFTNSIKMKLSVIFGVLHMSMGIVMKGTNMIFHRKWTEFFTEVLAGFLLLFFLFGWMDVLIITKWFMTPDIQDCSSTRDISPLETGVCIGQYRNRQTQGIIGVMVTTVFQFGAYDADLKPPQVPLVGGSMSGQFALGQSLVYTAILLIFVMLCTKPCMVKLGGSPHVHEEIEFQQVNQQDDN